MEKLIDPKAYNFIYYTRSLGARWAPTSRPAARTPGPTGPSDPGPRTTNPAFIFTFTYVYTYGAYSRSIERHF